MVVLLNDKGTLFIIAERPASIDANGFLVHRLSHSITTYIKSSSEYFVLALQKLEEIERKKLLLFYQDKPMFIFSF